MTFTAFFRFTAWTLGASAAAVLAAGEGSVLWLGVYLALYGAGRPLRQRGILFPPRTPRETYGLFSMVAAGFILLLILERDFILFLSHFTVLLLAFRLHTSRIALHYVQAALLSTLLVILACFLPRSFLFFATLIYFAFAVVTFLVFLDTYNRRVFFVTQGRSGALDAEKLLDEIEEPLARRTVLRSLALFVAGAGFHILLVACMFFLLTPRLWIRQANRPSEQQDTEKKKGEEKTNPTEELLEKFTANDENGQAFRETVNLKRKRSDVQSERRVIAVRFYQDGERIPPPSLRLYFKSAVLDRFNGRTWSQSPQARRQIRDEDDGKRDMGIHLGKGTAAWGKYLCQEIWVKADLGRRRFWMDELMGVAARTAWFDDAGSLKESKPYYDLGHTYSFRIYSRPSGRVPHRKQDGLEKYLVGKGLSPRVARLARLFAGDESTPQAKAERIVAKLRKNFTYKLSFKVDSDRPLDQFLFRTRTGNCEFFSTALAMLLRTVDVPTRLVLGYYGGTAEHDDEDVYLSIRELNAHCWVEVYQGDRGWVRYDATPLQFRPGVDDEESTDGLFDGVTLKTPREEKIKKSLMALIEGFDGQNQGEVLSWGTRGIGKVVGAAAGGVGALFTDYFLITAPLLTLIVIVVVLRYTRPDILSSRRSVPEGLEDSRRDSTFAFYVAFLKALSRLGFTKSATRTPLEFANAVAGKKKNLAEDVLFVTTLFNRARYGGLAPEKGELQRINEVIRSLRKHQNAPRSG